VDVLAEQYLRRELEAFEVAEWVKTNNPAKRIDVFISLHKYALREASAADPDVVFLTLLTSVLADIALHIPDPLRDQFLRKVEMLRFA
jgi:hypothetical protein